MRYVFTDFINEYGQLSRADYLTRFPHPMLFQLQAADGTPLPLDEQKAVVSKKARRITKGMVKTPLDTSVFVLGDASPVYGAILPILNKSENASRSFIGIGRDPSADIEVPDATVSPRHGLFRQGAGHLTFTDASSQHGTYLRGRKVKAKVAERLMNHDDVRFGFSFGAVYFTADGFYEFLKACTLPVSQ